MMSQAAMQGADLLIRSNFEFGILHKVLQHTAVGSGDEKNDLPLIVNNPLCHPSHSCTDKCGGPLNACFCESYGGTVFMFQHYLS